MAQRRGPAANLRLRFEGREIAAVPGESIAAALAANGVLAFGKGKDGAPRGLFCGMGVCHECLVAIDGRAGQRACLVKAEAGMDVRAQDLGAVKLSQASAGLARLPETALPRIATDVLVIGAGPGGLHAALAARRTGAQVFLLDERPAPGGQYFKQGASALAPGPDSQMRQGAGLIARLRESGAAIESETLVYGIERDAGGGLSVAAYGKGSARLYQPKMLVIATGAYETPIHVPGWTLPGAMTTGAAQTLLRSYGVAPGRRIVFAGNGPLNLQVACEAMAAGAADVTLVEAAPSPFMRPLAALALAAASPALAAEGLKSIAWLKSRGARLFFGARLTAIEGEGGVAGAIIRGSNGKEIRLTADAVCMGDGFSPAAELPRLLGLEFTLDAKAQLAAARGDDGSTSQRDVFVAGEAGGFGGAHIAAAMGELAGLEAARRLGFAATADSVAAKAALSRHRYFQVKLWKLFEPAFPREDSGEAMLCRCEAKSRSELLAAIQRHDIRDTGTLKRLTRAGMGRCQGRYCMPELHALLQAPAEENSLPAPQTPVRPVPLAALAAEKPEWGGHRRVDLPDQPLRDAAPLDLREIETLVIGAGIAGISTALFLARRGRNVAVVDRGPVNSGASGSNAGSLHAQLLSFDHGAKAEAGGGPAARTLPLQRDSILLWQSLERELGLDFEIKITGGLMVAESGAHMKFLAAKTAVERGQGIDCDVIGREELRRLEPALDERFAGAAYCPQEGKINPLTATEGLHRAALAAGARIFTGADVRSMLREGSGFSISTNRGSIRAKNVINCAGGFASRIGAMLGVNVPVFGAPLQMVVTEAVEPLISRLVAHAGRHLTLKQAANGNFIIGGGWTAALDPVRQHPRPLIDSIEGNLWAAQHVVPSLRRLHVLRTWAAMNVNIDGAPILGEHPAVPGFFNCVTSNGYTLGPIMGQLTAALAAGDDPGRDISGFSIARFG